MIRAAALAACLVPAVACAQAAPPAWVAWTDPTEGAFRTEVPAGWQVTGGLARQPGGGTRTVMELRAPDGSAEVGIGDAALPTFLLRSPMYQGIPDGSPIGGGLVLASYEPGEVFAQDYGGAVFGRACGRKIAARGHAVIAVPPPPPMPGMGQSSSTAGIAEFACDTPGRAFVALAVTRTEQVPFTMAAGGAWSAATIGRIAGTTPQALQTAVGVYLHVTASMRADPGWELREAEANLQATLARGRQMSGSGPSDESVADYRSRIMREIDADKTRASDRTSANFADYIADRQRLRDPNSGTLYVAPSGAGSYTLQPGGGIVGSEAGQTPPEGQALEPTQN